MKQKYIDFIKQAEKSDEYWAETIISDFTEEVCRLMDKRGINRTKLANKINSSPAYITKVLRGNANFTLTTMTKLARALGAVVRVHLAPENVVVRWEDKHISTDSKIDIFLQPEDQLKREMRFIVIGATSNSPVINAPVHLENNDINYHATHV